MQPILIASVVAILLIGTYLVLNKKNRSVSRLKEGFGSDDLWLWTAVDGTPCGRFLGSYHVTQVADGMFTGMSDDGNIMQFGPFPYIVDGKTVKKDVIYISGGTAGYVLKAPNVLSFTFSDIGPMLFQPASNLPKQCMPPAPVKIPNSAWNSPGSPYAVGAYPQTGQTLANNGEYLKCLVKVSLATGTDAAQSFCQSGCQSYCINNGLGTVQACGRMCL